MVLVYHDIRLDVRHTVVFTNGPQRQLPQDGQAAGVGQQTGSRIR